MFEKHFIICIHISLRSGEIYIYIYNTIIYKLPVSILVFLERSIFIV